MKAPALQSLNSFLDLVRPQTAGTDFNFLLFSVHNSVHRLNIRFNRPSGSFVGVADQIARGRGFSAYFAFVRHFSHILYVHVADISRTG